MSNIDEKTKRNSVKRNTAIVLQYVFLKLIYHLHNMFIFYPRLDCSIKLHHGKSGERPSFSFRLIAWSQILVEGKTTASGHEMNCAC